MLCVLWHTRVQHGVRGCLVGVGLGRQVGGWWPRVSPRVEWVQPGVAVMVRARSPRRRPEQ